VHHFGVELLGERGEARHVSEKDSDLLALAFQGAPGGQDLVGQVSRGIGQGVSFVIWGWVSRRC
jgi:hypothetical protein